jgi:hypothetical protein
LSEVVTRASVFGFQIEKEKNEYLVFLESMVVVVCLFLFLLLMKDVWNKFASKLTATGVQLRTEQITKKLFPHLTICPWPGFKKQGLLFL